MKNVTLRQLKVFEAIGRHLSFSRAAEELHLTQPAVSMQVKSLEDSAGLPLTEQVGKKIRLTPAGEEVARTARRIALQLREAEEALAAMKGAEAGRLLIGVVSTAKYFAPALLAEFKRRHPGVELRLSVSNRSAIVRQLAENEIDLAIMGSPPREFDTVAEVFAEHPLVFIAAPGHPLTGKKIDAAVLTQEILLIREQGSGTRSALERYLEEQKVGAGETAEMSSNETLKQAVMAGMGVAFISEHTIGLERSVGRLAILNITGTPVKRQWHLVHRAEKRLLPTAEAFREFMRKEGARLIAAQVTPPKGHLSPP
jgi:DNA-binding transcriptional LysR family regulator